VLLRRAQFFTPGEPSPDYREVHRTGGRGAEAFYRERWRHDKVVRSTHGVNCTGSCSWKVYVKDGIITWETQQTDYPSVGPDSPEYEPRRLPARRVVLVVHILAVAGALPVCAWAVARDVARGPQPAG
jgi:nitrate reductase / nitrite oxidoreductase, alpha subunit